METLMGQNCYISNSAVISDGVKIGNDVRIQDNVVIQENVVIQDDCIICANSVIKQGTYLDFGVIVREKVTIGQNSFIGARSIIGEYLVDFIRNRDEQKHDTVIGNNAVLRSETIIYGGNVIGDEFQTGHRVTIREKSKIGDHVRIGTLSDIQGDCEIGSYVNLHSNVHIGQKSKIKDYVWIFPYVVLTNDPNPPSEQLLGVTVEDFSIIATGSVVLPGIHIGKDSLVGAGAIVNKNVGEGKVVVGNPIREIGNTADVKNKSTGEPVYPWRYHFDRGMPWKDIGYDEWLKNL